MTRPRQGKRPRGYSLAELLVASSCSMLLVAGMTSSIYIASHALDEGDDRFVEKAKQHETLGRVMEDVQDALSFSERTATAITFDVPDRDGDLIPESIRYAWSGFPGDPLTYQYNGSAPVEIAADVQDFSLASLTRSMVAPQPPPVSGGGDLLLVVGDPNSLTAQDTDRQTLLESWGYTVQLIDDSETQANMDAAAAAVDVVYVAPSISGGALAHKLTGSPAPIVNEFPGKLDNFGFASSTTQTAAGDTITIVDKTHYIGSVFTNVSVNISTALLLLPVPGGTLAPDLEVVAKVETYPAVVALESGAQRHDGGTAPARRVHMPYANADVADLTEDGKTLLRRAVEWAAGAEEDLGGRGLLYVSGGTVVAQFPSEELIVLPTAEEQLRVDMFGSWDFKVTLIHESSSQADFDAAGAICDVAYISQEASATTVGSKLTGSVIGVVNENKDMIDEFGFGSGASLGGGLPTMYVGRVHYITSVFAAEAIAPYVANDWYQIVNEPVASGVDTVGTWVEAPWTGKPALMALSEGAALYGGGSAPGRRVQLPWGSGQGATPVALNSLSEDARTVIKRSIEWAAGADGGGAGGGGGDPPITVQQPSFAKGGSNSSSLSIAKPLGTGAGDLLIAAVATDGDTSSALAASPDWNPINVGQQGLKVTFGVWWKLAGPTEPSSYQFNWSSNEQAFGWIMRFTGHDPTSPIATAAMAAGLSSSPTANNVITGFDNALILRLGGFDDDDITVGGPGLPGHTPIITDSSNSGNGSVSGGAGYKVLTTAGNSGASDFALTKSRHYRTTTIAIRPNQGN